MKGKKCMEINKQSKQSKKYMEQGKKLKNFLFKAAIQLLLVTTNFSKEK